MTQDWSKRIVVIGFCILTALPVTVFAEGFVSLLGLPTGATDTSGGMQQLVNTVLRVSIVAAALVAVLQITFAGAEYVLSDIVTTKEDARKRIRSAVLGLLLIITSVTILTTINPQLTNLPALRSAPPPSPPAQQPTDPEIDQICDTATGGCVKESCEYVNSATFLGNLMYDNTGIVGGAAGYAGGWIVGLSGVNYFANVITCEAVCTWFAGEVVDNSFGNSGNCVRPNNPETFRAAQAAAREALANAGFESKIIEFTDVSGYRYLESDIEKVLISKNVSDESNIIGVYDISKEDEIRLLTGRGDIAKYESVLSDIAQKTCESVGGRESVKISGSSATGGRRYYCIR